jgi:cysteinyl-tRNA synthetase
MYVFSLPVLYYSMSCSRVPNQVLNIRRARMYPKATEYISDIEEMVTKLIDLGNAYKEKGSVYYRVSSFKDYGKFANIKFDDMVVGSGGFGPNDRRGGDEKGDARDFALWKSYNEKDGEVVWDSAFGKGRPGWHIECSAMCHKLLGRTIDIHAGGVDLVFPHHQNEIAQTEAYTGLQFLPQLLD